MKTYRVYGELTVSCWTMVQAESPEQALEIAKAREPAWMTFNALTPDDDEAFHFENDGAPQDLQAEEV